MYTFTGRVRYSETGEAGRLTPAAVINYMQDASTFHSQECGLGIEHLEQVRKAWLLSSWDIVVDRCPVLGQDIVIGTWPTAFKGIYGYRNFVIRTPGGEDLVRAASVWFLMDLKKGVPGRIQPEDVEAYGAPEPALDLGRPVKKLPVPERYEEGGEVVILPHYLDSNHHVNNARYVELAAEMVGPGKRIRRLRVDYRKAAMLGDRIVPRFAEEPAGRWTVALCSPQGEVYAVVQMDTEEE